MAMISNDWMDAIRGEFSKDYYRELYQFVKQEYSTHVVYPPADDIFNACHFKNDDNLRFEMIRRTFILK